jgi:hypothetical protein
MADKLGSPGANVTVVAFGGSITGEELQLLLLVASSQQ